MTSTFWNKAQEQGIDISEGFAEVFDAISGPDPVIFVTGKAGTGKSTLLQYLRDNLDHNTATIAPTGVSAVNVGGQTIHSFFSFGIHTTPSTVRPDKRKDGLMNALNILFIDEVSMVRADLMDCINASLRRSRRDKSKLAFGGVKLVCFGDLYQLPPVVTHTEKDYIDTAYASPFFFDAKVFERVPIKVVELTTVHRQDMTAQSHFLQILNSIRNGTITQDLLTQLNHRVIENLDEEPANLVTVTAHKDTSAKFNEYKLSQLDGTLYTITGSATGEYRDRDFPTDLNLKLKIGAQVMLLNNDPQGRWVNGDLAVVTKIVSEESTTSSVISGNESTKQSPDHVSGIFVKLTDNQKEYPLDIHRWDSIRATYSPISRTVEQETIGSFHQYPITLAWAVTIHKCQGKTFENVCVDLGYSGAFASGQTYVALSRCRTLEGLYLKRPITPRDLITDSRVADFFRSVSSTGLRHPIGQLI